MIGAIPQSASAAKAMFDVIRTIEAILGIKAEPGTDLGAVPTWRFPGASVTVTADDHSVRVRIQGREKPGDHETWSGPVWRARGLGTDPAARQRSLTNALHRRKQFLQEESATPGLADLGSTSLGEETPHAADPLPE